MEFSEVMQGLSQQLHKGAIQTGKTVLEKYSYDRTSQMSLPQAVIKAHSEVEVQSILRSANENVIPVVTRGAGSSLTGAVVPITRGIVLDVSDTYDVDEETGDKYCDECGVLVNNIKNRY